MRIGTVVLLKEACLGNSINSKGICYNVYNLSNRPGYSVIFENGEYDGFSPDECNRFLEEVMDTPFTYNFTNVMKLSRDYDNGIFKDYL